MKIISWNVAGLRACLNKGLLNFIQKEAADAYCFQEIKSEDIPFIEGYNSFAMPARKKGYSGILIYSKTKPLSVIKGIGEEDFDNEGRVLALEFENFFLINTYFPHSNRELSRLNFKLRFDKTFAEFCQNLEQKKPIIIAGDFNVAHKEIDLRNPKQNVKNAGFTAEERFWFDSFLKQSHVDAFRQFCIESENYTWWPYRNNCRQRNIGWRIDYFVVSETLRGNLKSSAILKEILGSDHCPISLELK
jgi:exodeoxyribonuclease-3